MLENTGKLESLEDYNEQRGINRMQFRARMDAQMVVGKLLQTQRPSCHFLRLWNDLGRQEVVRAKRDRPPF